MRITSSEQTIEHYIAKFDMVSFLNDDLLEHLQLFRFPAYSYVYIEQEEQHYLYFLVEGQVQCSHYNLNGKLAVFALSTPFAAIGDLEILTDAPVNSNVIAMQETVMLGIDSVYVSRYGVDDPRFLRFLIDQLRDKLYKSDMLHRHQLLPVINRLAVYMLAQPVIDGDNRIVLPGKEELASLLGTTSRHLNRVIKELVEMGGINSGYPMVRILDRSVLEGLPG